jgi:hypothetical protein
MNSRIDQLVATWQRAFKVTLRNKKAYKIRLTELTTWDKARADNEIEHSAKIKALELLLQEIQ